MSPRNAKLTRRARTIVVAAALVGSAAVARNAWADPDLPTGIPNDVAHTFNITSAPFNASTLNTATQNFTSISNAIGSCNLAGGGKVIVPAGTFQSLPNITISSLTNFEIDGTLQAVPLAGYVDHTKHLLNVSSSTHDVIISGSGTLDGNATFSSGAGDTEWWGTAGNSSTAQATRPRLLRVNSCTRFEMLNVHLMNSPSFHVSFNGSVQQYTIDNVGITAPSNSPNTDAIDLTGTVGLVKNCNISVGDDDVVMKPGGTTACASITISTCTFGSGHGVSIGGQTSGGMNGFTVSFCTFNGTSNGIHLKAARSDGTFGQSGGLVQNLTFSNLTMTGVANPFDISSYYVEGGDQTNPLTPTHQPSNGTQTLQAGAPVLADLPKTFAAGVTPQWNNLSISDITINGTASSNNFFYGVPEGLLQNLSLSNINYQTQPSKGLNFLNNADVHISGAMVAPVQCINVTSMELSGTPGAPPTLTQTYSTSLESTAVTLLTNVQGGTLSLTNFNPAFNPDWVNTARISGDFNLGRTAGTSGVYNLNSGTVIVGGTLYVGNAGTGVFNQSNGKTNVGTALLGNVAGGLGSLTVSAGFFTAGATSIRNGSQFNFNGGAPSFGSLDLQSSGKLIVAPGGGVNVVRATWLSMGPGTQLDLADNDMILDYSGSPGTLETDLRDDIFAGRLMSSTASPGISLAYADNANLHLANFAGGPVDGTSMLVRLTYTGDANFDGQVDIQDLLALATDYNTSGNVWMGGDFNYDGVVDGADLALLAANWQAGVGNPLPGQPLDATLAGLGLPDTSVPEPTFSISVGAFLMSQIGRRRQRMRAAVKFERD